MTDIEKSVVNEFESYINDFHCACTSDERIRECCEAVLELLKSQHTEIERMKAEKNRVIEHIESEIHRLFKERGCVKDDVGIAQYQWLINGYQSALDMIKDGEQE